jgi:putative transposase
VGFGPLYQGRFKSFAIEQDRHLLTVFRYVERNALRAKLVQRAEDWRWSSLHIPQASHEGVKLPTLSVWPIARPSDWLDRVNAPQTPAEEKAVQESILRCRPFGSPDWQIEAARELNLHSCFRPRGRPCAKRNAREK